MNQGGFYEEIDEISMNERISNMINETKENLETNKPYSKNKLAEEDIVRQIGKVSEITDLKNQMGKNRFFALICS